MMSLLALGPRRCPGGKEIALFLAFFFLGLTAMHGRLLTLQQVVCGGDLVNYFVPLRMIQEQQGWFTPWSESTMSGYPVLENIQSGAFYPLNWLHWLPFSIEVVFTWQTLLHLLLGGLGFYFFARRFLWSGPALVAALVWGFSAYLQLRLSNGVIVFTQAFAWVPWMAWAATLTIRKEDGFLPAVALLGLFGGMQLSVGAPQIVQITWFGVGVIALTGTIYYRNSYPLIALLGGLGLALVVAFPTIIGALAMNGMAAPRAVEDLVGFLSSDALSLSHLVAFPFPEFFGPGNAETRYWQADQNFLETNFSIGVPALVLAVVGLIGLVMQRPVPLTIVVAGGALAIFSFAVAFGANGFLFPLLVESVPTFGLFRAPSRWALWVVVALALLAGFGLQVLIQAERRQALLILATSVIAVLLPVVVARLFVDSLLDWAGFRFVRANAPEQIVDAFRATAIGSITAALLFLLVTVLAFVVTLQKRPAFLPIIAAMLVLSAQWHFWRPFTAPLPHELPPGVLESEAPYHRIARSAFREEFYPRTSLVALLEETVTGRLHYTDSVISWMFDQDTRELFAERPVATELRVTRGYQQLHLMDTFLAYYRSFSGPIGIAPGPFLIQGEILNREFFDAFNVSHVLAHDLDGTFARLQQLGLEVAQLNLNDNGLGLFRNPHARGWAWLEDAGGTPRPDLGDVVVQIDPPIWAVSVTIRGEEPAFLRLAAPSAVALELVNERGQGFRLNEPLPPGNHRFVRDPRPQSRSGGVLLLWGLGYLLALGLVFVGKFRRGNGFRGTIV